MMHTFSVHSVGFFKKTNRFQVESKVANSMKIKGNIITNTFRVTCCSCLAQTLHHYYIYAEQTCEKQGFHTVGGFPHISSLTEFL